MKKFRKAIVALLAMVMVLGCLAVTASAAEDTYNVAGAAGLCGTDWDPAGNQMEKDGDVWVKEFKDVKKGTYEFKVVLNGKWGTEYNLEGDASSGGGNASVEVKEDGSTVVVKFDGTKASVTVATDSATGVSAPVVAAVIAVVSMVGIVVFAKRRTVAE